MLSLEPRYSDMLGIFSRLLFFFFFSKVQSSQELTRQFFLQIQSLIEWSRELKKDSAFIILLAFPKFISIYRTVTLY